MLNYFLTSGFIHAAILLSLCLSPDVLSPGAKKIELTLIQKEESPPILPSYPIYAKSLESGFRDQKHEKIDPKDYAEKLKSIVDPVWVSKIEPYQSKLTRNYEIIVLLFVNEYGKITSIRIKKGSGMPELDALAIKTFEAIGAIPNPPELVVKDGVEWDLNF